MYYIANNGKHISIVGCKLAKQLPYFEYVVYRVVSVFRKDLDMMSVCLIRSLDLLKDAYYMQG